MSHALTAVLYSPGTNCHEETSAAIELAGGRAKVVLLRDLLDGREHLSKYQAAVVPGGFSYGDHLGAGRVFATILVAQLRGELEEFLAAGKPVLGICNGFQVLTEAGILPGRTPGKCSMALIENQSARFEDRKGRSLVCESDDGTSPRVVFRFADEHGEPTLQYPDNPNGAPGAMAGVTDKTGLVLGLMPHPERASFPANYSQDGLEIFRNLARWLKQ